MRSDSLHTANRKCRCFQGRPAVAVLLAVLTLSRAAIAQDWAFEETFDGDPSAPSQVLLPRSFEYVATHRTHPKEQFTRAYPAFPADHAADCTGPNPAISPLPQRDISTTQTSNSPNPDPSFFVCKNHMMSSMGQVDPYSNSVFWPRQEFDFSNGGTLEFDVNINEGHTIRSWWEVLIAPRDQMRFSAAPLQSAVDETYPRDRIVLDFRGDVRQIRVGKDAIAPDGWIAGDRHFGQYDYLDWRDLYPEDPALEDRRIRRTMRIRLEGDTIIWGIKTEDGSFDEFSVAVPGGLPFTRGIVQFKTHAYTPYKLGNQSFYTFHWDNIRFSGPELQPYTAYHADDVVYLQRDGNRPIGDEATVTLTLPENLGENPVLVGQINGAMNGQPRLSINGGPERVVALDDYPVDNCVSGQWRDWGSFRVPLEPGALRPGENTLRWKVGPRPTCAAGQGWWDGYSVKFLHVQADAGAAVEPPIASDNTPPELTIVAPPNAELTLDVGETITLIASAFDSEDGDISSDISWSSSIDGPLGSAAMLTPVLTAGEHLITADVSDSGGLTVAATVTITVPTAPGGSPVEIILDDQDSAVVSRTGGWKASAASDFWGDGSLYSTGRNSRFRWRIDVPEADTYQIYIWWTAYPRRSRTVPVRVAHDGGTDTQYKSQRVGGGRWQLLGSYRLQPGGEHYVEVSGENGQASADAVRVVRESP